MHTPTIAAGPGLDEARMRRAIAVARHGMTTGLGGPFGAVVARGDEIVGEGCNRVTSSNDPTAHAEIVAIRDACARLGTYVLAGCTLVTSCEPCPMCLGAAHWARLDAIVYGASRQDAARGGFDDALLYEEIGRPPGERIVPARRALADEAARLFDDWLAKADRRPY